MKKLLKTHEFNKLVQSNSHKRFLAPVRLPGRGRFSDTALVKYGPIQSVDDVVWDQKTYLSPKEAVFPITETLLDYSESSVIEPATNQDETVLFCRACDIHAIARLDNIFLKNGPVPDPYYLKRRNKIEFVLMECTDPFDSCFCVTMGTNTVDSFSAAIRKTTDGVCIDARSDWFISEIAAMGSDIDFQLQFPHDNGVDVTVPRIDTIPGNLFTHTMWEEYSRRCIACGRCNTSCPTCSCFSVSDVSFGTDNANRLARRERVWDGCHLDGFTAMAGGASFRKDFGSRMRYKTFHKIYDYRKRFGVNMCVGCGRCDDVCPEYISFANCINKVNELCSQNGTAE
jgi:anaerobic sulfite reductase subunit A